jgi:hypothetical protein
MLLLPVGCFLMGATFIAVYWPLEVEPDQGRGAMDGAGVQDFGPRAYVPPPAANMWRLPAACCVGQTLSRMGTGRDAEAVHGSPDQADALDAAVRCAPFGKVASTGDAGV